MTLQSRNLLTILQIYQTVCDHHHNQVSLLIRNLNPQRHSLVLEKDQRVTTLRNQSLPVILQICLRACDHHHNQVILLIHDLHHHHNPLSQHLALQGPLVTIHQNQNLPAILQICLLASNHHRNQVFLLIRDLNFRQQLHALHSPVLEQQLELPNQLAMIHQNQYLLVIQVIYHLVLVMLNQPHHLGRNPRQGIVIPNPRRLVSRKNQQNVHLAMTLQNQYHPVIQLIFHLVLLLADQHHNLVSLVHLNHNQVVTIPQNQYHLVIQLIFLLVLGSADRLLDPRFQDLHQHPNNNQLVMILQNLFPQVTQKIFHHVFLLVDQLLDTLHQHHNHPFQDQLVMILPNRFLQVILLIYHHALDQRSNHNKHVMIQQNQSPLVILWSCRLALSQQNLLDQHNSVTIVLFLVPLVTPLIYHLVLELPHL